MQLPAAAAAPDGGVLASSQFCKLFYFAPYLLFSLFMKVTLNSPLAASF